MIVLGKTLKPHRIGLLATNALPRTAVGSNSALRAALNKLQVLVSSSFRSGLAVHRVRPRSSALARAAIVTNGGAIGADGRH